MLITELIYCFNIRNKCKIGMQDMLRELSEVSVIDRI